MNTTNPQSPRALVRRAAMLTTTASLLLAPCLYAQTSAAPVNDASAQKQDAPQATEKLYTVKFDGGMTTHLRESLRAEFPADNFVLSESVERLELPSFELRNVRLREIGRTIEFLGKGQLRVEVTESAGSGNLWLIGPNNPTEVAATLKMRSVAAPNLFANENALAEIQKAADELERDRVYATKISGGARGVFRGARIKPLASQGIFAIVGDEEGVAGLENLIQVAEQKQSIRVEELLREAPKMKAVAAPHLFADKARLDRFLQEFRVMSAEHGEMIDYRWKTAGFPRLSTPYWAQVHPRFIEDIFMIIGNPDAIVGIESLIQAGEQLAAAEDALADAKLSPEQRAERDAARAKAKDEARAKEKARLEAEDEAEAKKQEEEDLKAAEKAARE